MNCSEWRQQVTASLDGNLDVEGERRLAEHLRDCSSCRARAEEQRAVRDTLRATLAMRPAPDLLLQSLRRAIDAPPLATPVVKAARRNLRWPVAMAAALLLCVAGTWQVASRRDAVVRLQDDVLASHVRSLLGQHLLDVESTDQHTVKPWFDGKLDFAPPVSDFAGRGYPLVGGRLEYVAGHTVAALVYSRRKHLINLFVWPADRVPASGAGSVTVQGYHIDHWTSGGFAYWAVSDLGLAELTDFDRLVQDADASTPK